ncbi:MAG: hypothetical protein LBG22_02540 [Treponema sp.]|jgi:Leu/Phe-tRNA-protein transferase|nr:hypothetical protein [Treponema sp.]
MTGIKDKLEQILSNDYLFKIDCTEFYYLKIENKKSIYLKNNANIDELLTVLMSMDDCEECFIFEFNTDYMVELIANGFMILSKRFFIDFSNNFLFKKPDHQNFISDILLNPRLFKNNPVIFFDNLHVSKSTKRIASKYELKVDFDFETIVDKCAEIHGENWLTEPLRNCFKELHNYSNIKIKMISFGVYKGGILEAGEFGVITKGIYTSYSGYHDTSSAGTVQIALMLKYLNEKGFCFCSMPGSRIDYDKIVEYKYRFGAKDINRKEYIKYFV